MASGKRFNQTHQELTRPELALELAFPEESSEGFNG
jgi:hypothetical protein